MAGGLTPPLPLDSRPKYYNYLEQNSIVSMLCHTSFKDWPNAVLPTKLSHSYFPTSFFCILPQTSPYLKAAILSSLEILNSLSISLQYHCLLLLFVYPTWNGRPMVPSLSIVMLKKHSSFMPPLSLWLCIVNTQRRADTSSQRNVVCEEAKGNSLSVVLSWRPIL